MTSFSEHWASVAADTVVEQQNSSTASVFRRRQAEYTAEDYELSFLKWQQNLMEHPYVDIYNEKTQEWCTGKVYRVNVSEETVAVQFDDDSEDVTLSVESGLIAPIGTHTGHGVGCVRTCRINGIPGDGWNLAANSYELAEEIEDTGAFLCDQCWPHLSDMTCTNGQKVYRYGSGNGCARVKP